DYTRAREWFEKAVATGSEGAELNLDRLPITEAMTTGRYAEALQLMESLAAKIEAAETERDGKPGKKTADALSELAWSELFAQEFPKALATSDRGHTLLPHDLSIETNRAHALMFLGRGDEAKTLYLAHKGQPMSEANNTIWERVITQDFVEL